MSKATGDANATNACIQLTTVYVTQSENTSLWGQKRLLKNSYVRYQTNSVSDSYVLISISVFDQFIDNLFILIIPLHLPSFVLTFFLLRSVHFVHLVQYKSQNKEGKPHAIPVVVDWWVVYPYSVER